MKVRKILKKTLAVVLAFAMIAPIMGKLEVNVKEAKASEATSNVESDDSLDVKFQVTQGVVTETDIEAYRGKYVMRAVSSVQNPDAYDEIGFKVVKYDATKTEAEIEEFAIKVKVGTVFKRINSTTGSANGAKETYTYSPKVVDTNGEYFVTAKFVIAPEKHADDYVVWTYGIKNGVEVTGSKRQICVNDGIEGCSTINMSFEKTEGVIVEKDDVLSVNLGDSASVIGVYGNSVNVRISGVNQSTLKSATQFSFTKDNTSVGSEVLRNHTTKYNGENADTSWYDVDPDAKKFIIATSADLYGLAKIANGGDASAEKDNFAGQEIYVVSDIAVNSETLITERMDDNYTKWRSYNQTSGEYEYAAAPTYSWTPISEFAGKFYGEGHTISGLYSYLEAESQADDFSIAFIRTTLETAELNDFKLLNSSFCNGGDDHYDDVPTGSIVGTGTGKLNTIYSEALVDNGHGRTGGLVGEVTGNNFIMTNCWFNGVVTGRKGTQQTRTGGLIGHLEGLNHKIDNCLNSGDVIVIIDGTTQARNIGGLIGIAMSSAGLNMQNSLNTGSIQITANELGNVGAITGNNTSTNTKVVLTNVYSTSSGEIEGNVSEDEIKGTGATSVLPAAFFEDGTWTTVNAHIPVLTSLKSAVIDDSWYDEDKNTFVLYDKADLYGFATLSQTNNFAGRTVKLGADIEVIAGDANSWEATESKNMWIPIGNNTTQFAGTFDGDLHTIQGLHLKTDSQYTGLFSVIGDNAVVKNLKLKNSYFESSGMDLGSIVGACRGKNLIDTVSSDAIVRGSYSRIGGLIGGGHGNTTVQYCCYEGTVTNTSTTKKYTGGIMGGLYDNSSAVITNCLNTGVVDVRTYTDVTNSIFAGGIVGATKNQGTNITIANCLMVGKVLVNADAIPKHFSLLAGYYAGSKTLNNNYAIIPDEWIADIQEAAYSNKPTEVDKEAITGEQAETTLDGFDFTYVWATVADKTPVLRFLGTDNEEKDARWYNTSVTEFVLYDKEDVYGFAELSQTSNFGEKTVKLGNDIHVNNDADNQWTPIGNSDVPFAGTFDGQGYTISNLYIETSTKYIGLFAATSPDAVVKHLVMDNATISSSTTVVGVIAGRGHGVFSDIKVTNATITGGGRLGGVIGLAQDSVTLSNCSFDGTITCVGAEKENRYIGGLLGYITKGSLKISNCMNAGTVLGSADNTEADSPGIGGIVGCINGPTSIEINSCLNVGMVKTDAEVAVKGVGPIVGRLDAPGSGFEKYAIEKCYTVSSTDLSGIDGVAQVAVDTIKAGAEAALPLLDWETQWESVDGDFPKVRFSQTGFVASAGIEVEDALLTNLTTLYPETRVLKQGDIHAHAKTDGDGELDIKAIDGTVDLATWKTQLNDLDMDFAASLDHQSTLHINNGEWNKELFLYGSEIGVAVKTSEGNDISIATSVGDKTFGVHQNLYFTNETDFKKVLTHSTFADAFDYISSYSNATYYNGGNFKLGALHTSTWKEFIQTVQNNNGFYALAHPMIAPSYITVENMDTYLTPYLVDGMGLEVMYKGLGTTNVKNGYQIWKRVLEDGYQIYATAGTDTHNDLKTGFTSDGVEYQEALTSFYAVKETGEDYWSEAYVRYLRAGNFTAGSVGIQMSVGNTQMGGTGSFEDAYLEIGIGAFHSDAYIEGHQYRVDVWRDNCVVYSQLINPTTEDAQMTAYLRTKADATCKFYRVTVYDVTTNTCIALSNPIWNSAY